MINKKYIISLNALSEYELREARVEGDFKTSEIEKHNLLRRTGQHVYAIPYEVRSFSEAYFIHNALVGTGIGRKIIEVG